MSRIFASLSLFAVLLTSVAFLIGLPLDLNDRAQELRALNRDISSAVSAGAPPGEMQIKRSQFDRGQAALKDVKTSATVHLLLGVASALAVILVSSISVTYFIGTGRWCREVTEAYALDAQYVQRSHALKRRSFPWALASMLTVITMGALGAASDPGSRGASTAFWVVPHFLAATGGMAVIGIAFYVQWSHLCTNHEVIQDVLKRVQEIRAQRGLEV